MAQAAVEVTVTGARQVAGMLAALDRAGTRGVRAAVRRVERQLLGPMLQAARSAAPRDTGRLQKAIKIQAWKARGANRGQLAVELRIKPGLSRADPGGAYYGWMVERGHFTRHPKGGGPPRYVPGKYMITRAYDAHGVAAGRGLADAVRGVIDAAFRSGGSA
jgi:hypothetical protein